MKKLLCAVVALCSISGSAQSADLTKITIGHTNQAADIGAFLADERGYFRDEGLAASFIAFDSGSKMIAPFASGDLDVGGGAPSAALYNAVGRGIRIKIVADKNSTPPGYPSLTIVVRKDLVDSGRYRTLADLRGMKLGTNVFGTSGYGTMVRLFQRTGLRTSDIDVLRIGYPAQLAALKNKAIDAAMPSEPITTEVIKSELAVKAIGDDELYPYHQNSVILFSPRFSEKKDLGIRFMRAYLRGVRDYNDALQDGYLRGPGSEAIINTLVKNTAIKDPAVFRNMIVNFCNPDGRLNEESLRADLESLKSENLIEVPMSLEDAVDTSFVAAAVQALGPYKKK